MVGDPNPEAKPVQLKNACREIVAKRLLAATAQRPGEGCQDRTLNIKAAQVREGRVGYGRKGRPGNGFGRGGSEARRRGRATSDRCPATRRNSGQGRCLDLTGEVDDEQVRNGTRSRQPRSAKLFR